MTRSRFARVAVVGVFGLGFLLGAAWRWGPWSDTFDFAVLLHQLTALRNDPVWAPVLVVGLFVMAGLLMVAHAAALWATALSFDPWRAVLYSELGSLASGLVVYGLARVLRRDVVRRLAGSSMDRISRALGRRGVLTLVILHIFPICPFSILNMIAGATHIRLRDFIIGTVLGATPGILLVCFLGHQIVHTIRHPNALNIGLLGLFLLMGAFVLKRFRRSFFAGGHGETRDPGIHFR